MLLDLAVPWTDACSRAQIVPWLSYSVPGVLNFGVFTFNTAAALACFVICVVSDPGQVPEDFVADAEHAAVVQVKRKVRCGPLAGGLTTGRACR